MKPRLLVMNGQRLVQVENGADWKTDKVEKAGSVKPGIYNLYLAAQADKSQSYDGVLVHADKENVYQTNGKSFVLHKRADFDKLPEIGANINLKYSNGKAVVSQANLKLGRSMTR